VAEGTRGPGVLGRRAARNDGQGEAELTAGLVIIGNEILSGRVADRNTPYFTRRLRELGIEVRRIEVVPDETPEIVRAVRSASNAFDYVFTSGGVGPTPDDVTVPAVAQALERTIVRSSALERLLQEYYKVDELTVAQGRLADIPSGAELIYGENSPYPQLVVGNVYVFPGVPELLQRKFEEIAPLLKGEPIYCVSLETGRLETDLAHLLVQLGDEHPQVKFGSYPHPQHVELVLESRSEAELQTAFASLRRLLEDG